MDSATRSGGCFRERILEEMDICFQDFANPWNYYYLFMSDELTVQEWCRANRLLASSVVCKSVIKDGNATKPCGGAMFVKQRTGKPGNATFRCSLNRGHERSIYANSFFEKSHLTIPDVMCFIKSYLDSCSLLQCSKFAGVAYGSTAVHWASYIRELFKVYFERTTRNRILSGEIEIDESLFGRKVKYNKGNPNAGLKVWVFGLVERSSNTVIMYPVSDRSADTLIPLIKRHVAPGASIYSDGWSAYCNLNDLGYTHFTVLHKYAFKKVYVNVETSEKVIVHTNRIEGAWKHAKEHFKRMSGTRLTQFEGHMAEIMWRSDVKGNVYSRFFELLQSVYTLHAPPTYGYSTPLFDSWTMQKDLGEDDTPLPQWDIEPAVTDAESEMSDSAASSGSSGRHKAYIVTTDEDDLPVFHGKRAVSRTITKSVHTPVPDHSDDDDAVVFPPLKLVSPSASVEVHSADPSPPRIWISDQESPVLFSPNRSVAQTPALKQTTLAALSEMFSSSDLTDEEEEADVTIVDAPSDLPPTAAQRHPVASGSAASTAVSLKSSKKVTGKGKQRAVPPKPRSRTDRVCHPEGFVEYKKQGESQQREATGRSRVTCNPYAKSAF